MESAIKLLNGKKTAKSSTSKTPTPKMPTLKTPTPKSPTPPNKTRKTRAKPTDTVLTETQIGYLLNHFELYDRQVKLTEEKKEGLIQTFSKIRIMRPKKFAETRQFYEVKKRSNEDEIYEQAKARIDNFFKYGDYHDYKYDGSYNKNGTL